jgi:hypothetical protein
VDFIDSAVPRKKQILPRACLKQIAAPTAVKTVVTPTPKEGVVPGASAQNVIAPSSLEKVSATAATKDVVPGPADERGSTKERALLIKAFRRGCSDEDVLAAPAHDFLDVAADQIAFQQLSIVGEAVRVREDIAGPGRVGDPVDVGGLKPGGETLQRGPATQGVRTRPPSKTSSPARPLKMSFPGPPNR